MKIEIERKFLVSSDEWKAAAGPATVILQGYLSDHPRTVRVRTTEHQGLLTIKGPGLLSRAEYEYEIPVEDAREMLLLCPMLLRKVRYPVTYEGYLWTVDVFSSMLTMAEIEMDAEDMKFQVPSWAGMEVTHDHAYTNTHLIRTFGHPIRLFLNKFHARKGNIFEPEWAP
jgi:adenylate cyclase